MKIASAKDMRAIDRDSLERFGVQEILLMENAARVIAVETEKFMGSLVDKNVCIVAGSGNNGGDALASARHFLNCGAKVKIFLVGNLAHLTPAAAMQRDICTNMGMDILAMDSPRTLDRLKVVLRRFTDVVIDGILGTGFSGKVREETAEIIDAINDSGKPVVAVDIASGVDADTGRADTAILARLTISLGLPKIGHFISPGAELSGNLLVDSIGIPAILLHNDEIKQTLIDDAMAASKLPRRPFSAHKGSCGRVLCVAGSPGLTGAAALTSQAALKVGAGIATLAIGESLHDLMEVKLTEVMTCPVEESERGIMGGDRALGSILQVADRHDVLLVGPGLGRNGDTLELVRSIAANVNKPLIIDADGIFAFCGHGELLRDCKQTPILTPHLGEMAAFLETSVVKLRENLVEIVRKAAKNFNAVFVVKSECTIVANPTGELFFTSKGNAGMATAGCGDVLAGTIAGILAESKNYDAIMTGVYLHGLAGDLAYGELGEGLVATDVLAKLPAARQMLKSVS